MLILFVTQLHQINEKARSMNIFINASIVMNKLHQTSKNGTRLFLKVGFYVYLIDRLTEALLLIFLPIKAVHLTLLFSKSFQRFFSKKCHLFLELLTEAYRNACSEGEAVMYRAHVAVLVHSEAFEAYLHREALG